MVDGIAKRLAAAVRNIGKLPDADLEAAADAAEQDDTGDNQVGGCCLHFSDSMMLVRLGATQRKRVSMWRLAYGEL